jgi:hypothetical protein
MPDPAEATLRIAVLGFGSKGLVVLPWSHTDTRCRVMVHSSARRSSIDPNLSNLAGASGMLTSLLPSGPGKSSLIERYLSGQYVTPLPQTTGVDTRTKTVAIKGGCVAMTNHNIAAHPHTPSHSLPPNTHARPHLHPPTPIRSTSRAMRSCNQYPSICVRPSPLAQAPGGGPADRGDQQGAGFAVSRARGRLQCLGCHPCVRCHESQVSSCPPATREHTRLGYRGWLLPSRTSASRGLLWGKLRGNDEAELVCLMLPGPSTPCRRRSCPWCARALART